MSKAKKVHLTVEPGTSGEHELNGIMLYPRRAKREPFYMLFYEAYNDLILNETLAGADIKILHFMAASMTHENVCEESITDICESIGFTRAIGSRAIKRLQEIYAIYPISKLGRVVFYMVNPHLVSKTRSTHHKTLINRWDVFHGLQEPRLDIVPERKPKKAKDSVKKFG